MIDISNKLLGIEKELEKLNKLLEQLLNKIMEEE